MCLVEIEGRNGTPASCTTPVAPGLKVHTQNAKLKQLRKGVMELYISDHPLDCLTCSANGDCELQDMAGAVGLREVRYGFEGENHLDGGVDASNPYFQFDAIVPESGEFKFTWYDDDGSVYEDSKPIAVS